MVNWPLMDEYEMTVEETAAEVMQVCLGLLVALYP
jgi:regulator of PEP synthase PpsR (kinase-PPPase family)